MESWSSHIGLLQTGEWDIPHQLQEESHRKRREIHGNTQKREEVERGGEGERGRGDAPGKGEVRPQARAHRLTPHWLTDW